MSVYALNNMNNNISELLADLLPQWFMKNRKYDGIFTIPETDRTAPRGRIDYARALSTVEQQMMDTLVAEDVLITSTLTNFSLDFISALQTVSELDSNDIRVIALMEKFDSQSESGQRLLEDLETMLLFRRNAFNARRQSRQAGIARAAAEGKYKGRQAYSVDDFPNFRELYDQYMYREIGKGEFAEKLGVSRPTLDKLCRTLRLSKGGQHEP